MRAIGYAALIQRFGLKTLSASVTSYLLDHGHRSTRTVDGRSEEFFPARDNPGKDWTDQLVFALKREGVNLEVLAALFREAPEEELAAWIAATPLSRYARQPWFLYDWLTGKRLALQDLTQGNYVNALDPEKHYALPRDTIDTEIIYELEYLAAFDAARRRMRNVVDMPDRRMDLFIRLCLQGKGRLSKAKREQFGEVSDEECHKLEQIVSEEISRVKPMEEE